LKAVSDDDRLHSQSSPQPQILERIELNIMKITVVTKVVASKDQVSCDLAGAASILNLKNSTYYGLDDVGNRVWELVTEPKPVSAICAAIMDEYEVTPDRCEHDVVRLLEDMAAQGLIEVRG